MPRFVTWWANVPQPIRDFTEGVISAAIGGGVTGVLALNLDAVSARQVEFYAASGAIAAVIAFARHRLAAN